MRDAATIAAFFAFLTVLVQTIANQWGAQRAREHELRLKRLGLDLEDEDNEKDGDK